MHIPETLKQTIEQVHGDAGREWLAGLPALIAECRDRWSLDLEEPFGNLSYNFVIPGCLPDGTAAVLKLGVPCDELTTEAAALDLWRGRGAVSLIAHDVSRGFLLMERVTPGFPLHERHPDPEATIAAAALMQALRREPPPEHSFPSLATWFRSLAHLRARFDGGTGPFPPDIIAAAELRLAELLASSDQTILLHGDLHHANILFSEKDGWTAIDPKGIVGDPGYEIGSFMLNRLPASAPEITAALTLRLSIFSEQLGIERERLAGWAFCHAVLSAMWSHEEGLDWSGTIRVARLLRTV